MRRSLKRDRFGHLLGTPHTGLDADYGLYLPLIVDDPRQPAPYDAGWISCLTTGPTASALGLIVV